MTTSRLRSPKAGRISGFPSRAAFVIAWLSFFAFAIIFSIIAYNYIFSYSGIVAYFLFAHCSHTTWSWLPAFWVWANNVRRSKTFPSAILKFKRIVSLSALWSATARTLRILVPPGKTSPPGRWRTYVRLHTDNTRKPPSAARGNRRRSPPCSRGKRRHVRAASAGIRRHLPLPPSWLFEISMRNFSPTWSCIIRLGGQAGAAVRPPVIGGHGAGSVFREGRAHPCQGIRFADASHERSEPRQRWLQGCLWLGDASRPQPTAEVPQLLRRSQRRIPDPRLAGRTAPWPPQGLRRV